MEAPRDDPIDVFALSDQTQRYGHDDPPGTCEPQSREESGEAQVVADGGREAREGENGEERGESDGGGTREVNPRGDRRNHQGHEGG